MAGWNCDLPFLAKPKKMASSALPAIMKRLVLVKKHHDLERVEFRVETAPVPIPRHGEVLVRMTAAPVNPSDYGKWYAPDEGNPQEEDTKDRILDPPAACGTEGSGVVVVNGGGWVGRHLLGKRVAIAHVRDGTYQEYVAVSSHMAIVVDEDIPLEDACSVFVNPFTAIGIAETAKEQESPCFIHSAGASLPAQILNRVSKDCGVTLVNVVRDAQEAELLTACGAEHVINTSDDNWRVDLDKLITALQITVGFDAIAGPLAGTLLSMLPPNGQLYTYGILSGEPIANINPLDIAYHQKRLRGWFLPTWLRSGGMLSTWWRFRYLAVAILPNVMHGKWAACEFKDCTLETMAIEFLNMYRDVGFNGPKLRIRFQNNI
eukprot:GEMP01013522.1.p1 GENE.GEMP01013522.1~~GEMP01013522.1.p1  ORF type:complete len:376 (+),score=103.37 GEMP01013522.1:83-1210(+)